MGQPPNPLTSVHYGRYSLTQSGSILRACFHYPAKTVKDFFKEDDQGVQIVSATGLLDQVDDLLYALLDYDRVEGWRDADDFESKEMMKLKEIMK